jgi:hypothetical protein
MRIKTAVAVTAALSLAANMATAAHVWEDAGGWWSDHFVMDRANTPKFTAHEVSLDVFGSFYAAERGIEDLFETNIEDGLWGGGVGLNYFLTREIGIGGDINMSDNGGNLVDIMQGSLIVRLPIESISLAPYIFGGGGRSTEPEWEWTYHGGVGTEFRFNPTTGIFADARYIWADETSDRLLIRAGFRLVF